MALIAMNNIPVDDCPEPHDACSPTHRCASCRAVWFVLSCVTCVTGGGSLGACDAGSLESTSGSTTVNAHLPPARLARYVKFEEVTEWNGGAWGSIAELNLIDSTGATMDRSGWSVSADSSSPNDAPANVIDGDAKSLWHTPWETNPPAPPHAVIVDLREPRKLSGLRYLPRQDRSANGTFAQYRIYLSTDGTSWGEPVAQGDFTQMSGPKIEKTVVFAEQTSNHPPELAAVADQSTAMGGAVSLPCPATDVDADPLTFEARGLPAGLSISPRTGLVAGTPIAAGVYDVSVRVSDAKGAQAQAAFKWTVQAPPPAPVAPGEVRFVKLEEVSEIHGQPWASMAQFNLVGADGNNLPRTGWTAWADSAEANEPPINAIRGNAGAIWHSQWSSASPNPPHSYIVDLGHGAALKGFRYLPRQDHSTNGTIAEFRFYTSVNGVDWGRPVAQGDLSRLGPPEQEKTVWLK
jgi:hypothetical protein